jgi:hypothetical protein
MSTGTPAAAAGHRGAGGYDRVLALLVASLVVGALLPRGLSAAVSAGLGLLLWLAVARATAIGRREAVAGLVVFIAIMVFSVATYSSDADRLAAADDLLLAAAVAALGAVIGRALVRERVVTFSTVTAVLCLYLLIGLFFAHAYLGVIALDADAFAGIDGDTDRFNLIYFSFIALTTVGFGDITPAGDVARALAATEAVMGQLFLVTVVARVVSLIGHERLKR